MNPPNTENTVAIPAPAEPARVGWFHAEAPVEPAPPAPKAEEVIIPSDVDPEAKEPEVKEPEAEVEVKEPEVKEPEETKEPTRYQKRLTAAQQELEYWKKVALEGKPAQAPAPHAPTTKPDFAAFGGDIEAYTEALTDWKLAGKFQEMEQKQHQTKVASTYQERVSEFLKTAPDFDEIIGDADPISQTVIEAIAESEVGPQLAYKLAKSPTEIARLNALSPMRQLVELGKLEAELSTKAAPKAPVKPTAAPKPLAALNGSTVSEKAVTDPSFTQAEWRARRRAAGLTR